MAEFVRMVGYLRIPRWEKKTYNRDRYRWLPKGDYPLDLIVKDCRNIGTNTDPVLSIFELEDRAYLDRILAGWAVIRSVNEGVGFIIFDENLPGDNNIKISDDPGKTADLEVNELHRNLKELTTSRTANLVNDVVLTGKVESRSEEDLVEIVKDAHAHGYLSLRNCIQPYWREILEL